MPLLQKDVDRFHKFATERIAESDVHSLQDLLDQWSAQSISEQELNVSLESLNRGLEDAAALRVRPADEVLSEMRQELALR